MSAGTLVIKYTRERISKNTNTSAMNPKYRACLAQKWEAHSFLPMVGGWVGGVRFIWLWLLKWKKIAIKNMIICLQIWGHWYDVWRELSTEFIGFTPRWVGGWVGSWGKWAAGCDSLQAPKVQEATSKSKTRTAETKKNPKVPTTGYPPPRFRKGKLCKGIQGVYAANDSLQPTN